MSIKVYLVDDESHGSDLLSFYATKIPEVEIVGIETDPQKALRDILSKKVIADVIYLDIDMPGLTGIELASMVKEFMLTVITTAHRNYGPESYEHDVVDYLLKPITFEKFKQSIDKVRRELEIKQGAKNIIYEEHLTILGNGKSEYIILETKDILFIQAASNYVSIATDKKEYFTKFSMQKVEEMLSPKQFIRVHKSFIVNLKKVIKFDPELIYLSNGKEIPISETYRKPVMQLLRPKQ